MGNRSTMMSGQRMNMLYTGNRMFLPPFGSTGAKFVEEVARLLQAYAGSSNLECIAMKGIVVLQQLLLQKPSRRSKVANCAKHLQKRIDIWLSGDVVTLLNEGKCIQKHFSKNPPPNKSSHKSSLARRFAAKRKQGNVQGTLICLSKSSARGILILDDKIPTGPSHTMHSVREILAGKHPASTAPSPKILLPADQQSEALNSTASMLT